MKRDWFIFYKSFLDAANGLSPEDKSVYYEKIIQYWLLWIEKKTENNFIESLFSLIKPQLDANNSKYKNGKKGAVHGAKWGRPKKPLNNPTGVLENNPKETPKEKEKDKEKDNVKEKGKDMVPIITCREDIRELLVDDEPKKYQQPLEVLLVMVQMGYKIPKQRDAILVLIETVKTKAILYWCVCVDGLIDWQTMRIRADKRKEWHTAKGTVISNHRNSLCKFLEDRPYSWKQTR